MIKISLVLISIRNAIRIFDFEKTKTLLGQEWYMIVCIQMISSYIHLVYYTTCFDNKNIAHKIFGIFFGLFITIALYFGYNDIN